MLRLCGRSETEVDVDTSESNKTFEAVVVAAHGIGRASRASNSDGGDGGASIVNDD